MTLFGFESQDSSPEDLEPRTKLTGPDETYCGFLLGVPLSKAESLAEAELTEILTMDPLFPDQKGGPPEDNNYYCTGPDEPKLPLVNGLVVEWDEEFASRTGFAQVFKPVWEEHVAGSKTYSLV